MVFYILLPVLYPVLYSVTSHYV